jgi:hypothetical protein
MYTTSCGVQDSIPQMMYLPQLFQPLRSLEARVTVTTKNQPPNFVWREPQLIHQKRFEAVEKFPETSPHTRGERSEEMSPPPPPKADDTTGLKSITSDLLTPSPA